MKRFLSAAMAFVAILTFSVATSQPAKASGAHCFGKAIVYVGDDAGSSINNPIIDLGQLASYNTQLGHDKDCADKVSAAAAQNANFNNKTWLCQQIQRQGSFRVSAYAAVGTRDYRVAQSIFVTCSGGVRTCTCPPGWLANTTNADGGVTSDGKCKKGVCVGNPVNPLPANGTPIGTWGFTWGNGFYAWGTAANGGGAHCVVSPWVGN
ncbi:MAG: hypothetical protein QOJ39_1758 [Candidatus Eremiobacteraeota bacterium]|jgi:hypothetical protein|nr:hypothetical protein [Candidatus Eremiobacteraeota bacterium]